MEKIKKFIFNLILFLFYSNFSIATDQITYDITGKVYAKKFLVFIGFILIFLILYISYKLDKKDEAKIKKDRYQKNSYNIKMQNNKEKTDEKSVEITSIASEKKISDETIMLNYASLKMMDLESKEIKETKFKQEVKPNMDSTMKVDVNYKKSNKEEKKVKEKDYIVIPKEEELLKETIRRYTRKKKRNVKKYTRKK